MSTRVDGKVSEADDDSYQARATTSQGENRESGTYSISDKVSRFLTSVSIRWQFRTIFSVISLSIGGETEGTLEGLSKSLDDRDRRSELMRSIGNKIFSHLNNFLLARLILQNKNGSSLK